ncbi:YfbU family protein [Bradyrhizobium ottawaense]|uniref:YfbU family protein n=1 Tax=Bradyrhizobium ottawaense TaxID=931866 RepID=UPI0030F4020B
MGLNFTKEQRLMLLMICDLYKKPDNREFNAELISRAIVGGHDWAIEWEYGAIFPEKPDTDNDVSFVTDVLDMWRFIEHGYSKLSGPDRSKIEAAVPYRGKDPKFIGFDGNNETNLMGIAQMMIDGLGRFESFKGRSLNSHSPSVARYSAMLKKWPDIRNKLHSREMTADEIIELLSLS